MSAGEDKKMMIPKVTVEEVTDESVVSCCVYLLSNIRTYNES